MGFLFRDLLVGSRRCINELIQTLASSAWLGVFLFTTMAAPTVRSFAAMSEREDRGG